MHPSLVDREYISTAYRGIKDLSWPSLESRDAHMASLLGSALYAVDRASADGETLVDYELRPSPDCLARCNASADGSVTVYHVIVPDLWAKVFRFVAAYDDEPAAVIAGLAAHEVRHRLQKRYAKKLRRFSPARSTGKGDIALEAILRVQRQTMRDEITRLKKLKTDGRIVRLWTGPKEFDACVIEHLVVRRLGSRASASEIAGIVHLNAP